MPQPPSGRPDPGADVVYPLDARPPLVALLVAGLQHVLSVFVPIITPPLLIAEALKLDASTTATLVGMAVFVSGLATFIQVRRIGPLGSGLLSVQGTSFSFVGVAILAGKLGGLPMIFGLSAAGSIVEMLLSRFVKGLRRLIPPLVSGVVVTLIGLTLIPAAIVNCGGGAAAKAAGTFGAPRHLAMALLVLGVIVALNRSRHPRVRMISIVAGIAAGYLCAGLMGMLRRPDLAQMPLFALPQPLRFGLDFSWSALVPFAVIYCMTAIETIGDITATSMVSGEPYEGEVYTRRLGGGLLADGFNSLLAAFFNSFPNTTFSQNNGIIRLTGVASRTVGYVLAGMLVVLGLSPRLAALVALMPPAVLGGATLLMFGTVAAAGLAIIASQPLDARATLILAVALGLGVGVTVVPDVLAQTPPVLRNVFGSGIATGGLVAFGLNLALPARAES